MRHHSSHRVQMNPHAGSVHSFTGSLLLAYLALSDAFIRSLARSLTRDDFQFPVLTHCASRE